MGVEDPAQRNVFYHKQKKKTVKNFNTNVKIFFLLHILQFMKIQVLEKAKIKKIQRVIVFKFLILILYFFAVAPIFSRISNKNN